MKVYGVYDSESVLLENGKNVFKTVEKYLSKYPFEYSKCYYDNIDTLELIKVDRLPDKTEEAIYNYGMNTIVFTKNNSLGHELFHMASNDALNFQHAFESGMGIEGGLVEGMTEYHHMKAFDLKTPGAYSFPVFAVMMLEDIPNIFESYFVPEEKGIFKVCPSKKYMYGLLYSIDNYNGIVLDYLSQVCAKRKEIIFSKEDARMAIRHVIDNLISIELLVDSDKDKLNKYADKFRDLINSNLIGDMVPLFYANCRDYADKQIKKRIKERL